MLGVELKYDAGWRSLNHMPTFITNHDAKPMLPGCCHVTSVITPVLMSAHQRNESSDYFDLWETSKSVMRRSNTNISP